MSEKTKKYKPEKVLKYKPEKVTLKSVLNACNTVLAENSYVVPVVIYKFNVLEWNMSEIRKTDNKICCYKINHPQANSDRIYLP